MAAKKQINQRKRELVNQLAGSRRLITHGQSELKQALSFKQQATSLVKRKPKAVFIGSVIAGLALTMLFRRRRTTTVVKTKRTTSQMLLSWALTFARPAMKSWVVARAKEMATGRHAQAPPRLED